MTWITTLDDLHALYGQPGEAATVKVTPHLTPAYRTWIDRARFCILTTIGPEGTDGSPRGDEGPVVTILDPQTIALPDWHGNNRIDSLRNIVRDPRVSLLFLIPGANNALRVYDTARLAAESTLLGRFDRDGKQPRTVIVIHVAEVYSQCTRAIIRSALCTSGDQSQDLPTVGDMLREITEDRIDGTAYDTDWPTRAAQTMW